MFQINEMDVEQLDQLRQEGSQDYVLIDVRSPMEVQQGKIEGGEAIPLHLIPLKMAVLPRDKRVIFYCRTGARSAQACAFATNQGLDNCYNLVGGIVAWVRSGKPII
ncbi:rhodanese-like domain-containing protein [Ectothiorhodospiraceae bacterium BW-2]|nr:rhodanese-like domain-containing protein [Ectothiorhodospiraceae bacterium BW-2]